MTTESKAESIAQYEGEFRFTDRDYYDRHLVFDHVVAMEQADQRQRFEAIASFDSRPADPALAAARSKRTTGPNPKQVYYLSMEFLIGRTLLNSITNLGVEPFVDEDLRSDTRHGLAPASGRKSRTPGWATVAWAGWRPVSLIRWRRWRSRQSATACAMNTACSVKRFVTATNSSSPTTG